MTEQSDASPLPTTLGRYRVLRRLGKGGMAEVFLARSTGAEGIEKLLVVKRVLPSFARSARFIAMFTAEAKVAVRLNHPNIVQVYGFEQVDDQFLLSMEYADGLDLGRLVGHCRARRVRMPHAVAAYIAMEVAKGLDYAHNRRDDDGEPLEIVHRDVSPQNILLTAEGVVKIADFGVAKARRLSEEPGVIKGKAGYMAPEQARGEPVDRRSDVYSLGVLLAELLMGRPAHPQGEQLGLLERVRRGELELPRPLAPTVPDDLERIVRRATAVDPEERFQSARSLAGALAKWLHAQEEVCDAETVERFVARVVPPREVAEAAVIPPPEPTASLGSLAEREVRENRPVVVVGGRLRTGEDTGAELERIDAGVRRVLEDIAYKADAALSWPEREAPHHFRFILGLGAASVHDPLTAVRVALDVREALEGLSADLVAPLAAGFGVSRGVLRTSRDARGRLLRYEPADDVLGVADGLCAAAEAGEVLASGEVYRLVRRVYAFDPAGSHELQLAAEGDAPPSVRAYRLRGALTRAERAADVGAVGELVGRGEERERIRAAYARAVESEQTVFVAVTGELGVGKTALVASALRELRPAPRVLRTEGAFGTMDVPFAAAAELAREAFGIDDDSSPEDCRQRLERGVQGLFADDPERRGSVLAGLRSLLLPGPEDQDEPDAERSLRIKRAVERLVSGLAAQGPLVVWADALQWLDAPSLEVLQVMLQRTYEVPVLVVLAGRPEPRVAPVLESAPRIEVGELADDADRRELVSRRFEGAEVPDDIVRAIVERGGGNPFFLIELVDALLERDEVAVESAGGGRRVVRLEPGPFALPATVEGVIAGRLAELGREEREALRWLAVAGPGMTASDLSALAGSDLSRGLEDLVARGFVERRAGGGHAFPNAVVRHVAYDTTDPDDRLRMHRRTAGYLRELGRGAPVAQIARHLELSGDRVGAADAYLEAARAASRGRSDREAHRLYGRAIGLLHEDSPRRFWAHEAREELLRRMGHPEAREREVEAMGRVAESRAEGRLRAVWHLRRGRLALDRGDTHEAAAALEAAEAEPDPDRATEIEMLAMRGEVDAASGRPEDALRATDRALARAGLSSEWLAVRGRALVVRSQVLAQLGRAGEAAEAAAEALVSFRRIGTPGAEGEALAALGTALAAGGQPRDAAAALRCALAAGVHTGDRASLRSRAAALAALYEQLGDPTRAEHLRQRVGLT